MSAGANRFYSSIKEAEKLQPKELVGLFAYYLTVEVGEDSASTKMVDDCFTACDLAPPSRTASYLSEGVGEKRFVKVDRGYKLQRHYREELAKLLGTERALIQTNAELRKLEARLPEGSTKGFLMETIDCFEAGANRATIVMCWILTLDHLIDHVMESHLPAFNTVLATNTNKRVKTSKVINRDDFADIPEGMLIEFLRSSGVISPDVRKLLDEKLGIRNSSAHPSAIVIKKSKVIEFVDDLVENVILKYKV
jgi:hypothetical protein